LIVVAGEINADLVLSGLSAIPRLGSEVLSEKSDLVLGSASAICASGLARLGNSVRFVGKAGDDLFGHFCIEKMKRAGIDVGHVRTTPEEMTGVTVSLSYGGDRALVTSPGTTVSFGTSDVSDDALDGATHLHVSSLFLQRALRPELPRLFERAHRKGLTTSLDPGHDPDYEWKLSVRDLKDVDLFLPNEEELKAISGRDEIEEALGNLGTTGVVAKLGASGAAAIADGRLLAVSAPRVSVVDTTGAGDSFDAGFLHAWLRKKPLETCLRYGVAAGSLSTRALGGTSAQPSLEELEAFLES
jgi:sugar/nucleoside kinase (ribokinase family)